MGEGEREEGRKRDGEIKTEREGGGWSFTQEKLSVAGVKREKEGRHRRDREVEGRRPWGGGRGGGSRFMKPLECNLEAEITVSLSKV